MPRAAFRAQARHLRDPWTLATGADFRFATTAGARPRLGHVATRYLDLLFEAASADPALRRTVGQVIHLLRRPPALLAPPVLARVCRRALRREPADGFLAGLPPQTSVA